MWGFSIATQVERGSNLTIHSRLSSLWAALFQGITENETERWPEMDSKSLGSPLCGSTGSRDRILSHRMYSSISLRKSSPPHDCQLVVYGNSGVEKTFSWSAGAMGWPGMGIARLMPRAFISGTILLLGCTQRLLNVYICINSYVPTFVYIYIYIYIYIDR